MFWGLHVLDIVAIIVYFSVTVWIGYRAAKKVKNQEDYFLGGRNFGKWIQTFAAFGQGTSAESVVTTTAGTGKNGAAGGWLVMAPGVLCLPFLWFTPLILRRMRLLNMADFFVDRYQSKGMAAFYAVTQAIFFMLVAAMGFKAMTATISAIAVKPATELSQVERVEHDRAVKWMELEQSPASALNQAELELLDQLRMEKPQREFSYINSNWLMIGVAIVVLLYAVAGGLEAAFVTDMIQGIFILLLTIILIPFAWTKIVAQTGVSPFTAMHTHLPNSMLELFGSPRLADLTWYYLLVFSIVAGLNIIAPANQMTACGSAKDDTTARVGFFTGIVIKRFCNVIWIFIGMLTVILYGTTVQDPDFIWGHTTRDLLGGLGIGLVGLMIACLMAALMSTADALMLTTSSLLTNNVYRLFVPNKEDAHYLFVGRILCALYIVGGVAIAMVSGGIMEMFLYMAVFNAVVAAAIWMGLLWRRANAPAAWGSMVVTFMMILALPAGLGMLPGVRSCEAFHLQTDAAEITSQYTASEGDVKRRQAQIEEWHKQDGLGKASGVCLEPLKNGESFEDVHVIPASPIFWGELVKGEDGEVLGDGFFNIELLAIHSLGFDLSKNTSSQNKTLAMSLKFFVPFGVLILIGLLTKPQDSRVLDLFYAKLRTPVSSDHEEDARRMALTTENPARFDHDRLFPSGNWEMRRWNKEDWIGIAYSVLAIVGVIGLLWGMLSIGQ
ncbi:sodium:solute symporter family protein [Verrucomicrobiaceae bacterium N1E253]|uniref:Sodium:solute symporter family protein n=1 Tax=Oceaniferula marina TaxID=2748318 RepID=A0A851GHA9_9BACT|nr:sodium:solute symporter family protein [Oceaniferula marina]NWK55241.1 sodium:solute symporter family protein [Oceaniferula marina]